LFQIDVNARSSITVAKYDQRRVSLLTL